MCVCVFFFNFFIKLLLTLLRSLSKQMLGIGRYVDNGDILVDCVIIYIYYVFTSTIARSLDLGEQMILFLIEGCVNVSFLNLIKITACECYLWIKFKRRLIGIGHIVN